MPLILHLSDLHFRKSAVSDADEKTPIDLAAYNTWHGWAKSAIEKLQPKPDFVIVSGDIRYRNEADSFRRFNEFCDQLIGAEALPQVDRFMIVPGNHDVERISPSAEIDERGRWAAFAGAVDRFPHAWLPSIHLRDVILKTAERSFSEQYAGGAPMEYDRKHGRANVVGLPFIFDPKAGVLIYGFNSAAISGSRVSVPAEVKMAMKWLDGWKDPNIQNWHTVRDFLEKRISVDPAQVRPDELQLFGDIISALRKHYGEAYEQATKIAVLHHHVAPMPAQEVKDFELLLNASDFKRDVAAAGFSIICHGHKHRPCVFRDAGEPAGARQLVLAGGTVGGDTPDGTLHGFNLIEVQGAQVRTEFVSIAGGKVARQDERHWDLSVVDEQPAKPVAAPRLNVGRITTEVVRALVGLVRERTLETGVVVEGWSHRGHSIVSPTSTAFALRLLRFSDPLPAGAVGLVSKGLAALIAMRHADGGWSSRYEVKRGAPESTAWVALGLRDWGTSVAQNELEAILGQLLNKDDEGHSRTFSIAHAVTTLAELYPDSPLIPPFMEILDRGAIRRDGTVVGWPAGLGDTAVSAVHTAYACIALKRVWGDGTAATDLAGARDALLEASWRAPADEIGRGSTHTAGRLLIKHYAPAVVVRALLELGVEPLHERIVQGVTEIAAGQQDGLWVWQDDNSKPIWMTYHAVTALHAWARCL